MGKFTDLITLIIVILIAFAAIILVFFILGKIIDSGIFKGIVTILAIIGFWYLLEGRK